MLVLTRNVGQAITIDGIIRIVIVGHRGDQVRLGIDGPRDVVVVRGELVDLLLPEKEGKESCALG